MSKTQEDMCRHPTTKWENSHRSKWWCHSHWLGPKGQQDYHSTIDRLGLPSNVPWRSRGSNCSNRSRGVRGFLDRLINSALIRAISSEYVYLSNRQSMSIKVYLHMLSKRAETPALLDSPVCATAMTTSQKISRSPKSLQRGWHHESERQHNLLLGFGSPHRRKTHQHAVLPNQIGPLTNDFRIPMVCRHATKDRLGKRMDWLHTITHHHQNPKRPPIHLHLTIKSNGAWETMESHNTKRRHPQTRKEPPSQRIPATPESILQTKSPTIPKETFLGPCDQLKTQCPKLPTRKSILPDATRTSSA